MVRSLGSRMKTARKRHLGVLTAVAAVLSLAACGPATPTSGPGTSATTSASTSPVLTPSPSLSVTPSADPTTATRTPPTPSAEPTTKAPAPATTEPAPAPPAPPRTRTQAPAPEPTQEPTDCYPLSNAGNCYKAGQICRKADVGTSGRSADGRAIHCREDSGVGQRWGY
ncbi:hypothetical protein [Streptomyces sp. NPDC059247]|uniref:hypothetical protein n=1 Tax=Streptomyces sp. NPDC059247 TaxID=3346790 RepID=UPI0036883267